MQQRATQHYGGLDGLRGVAAIAVVIHHLNIILGDRDEPNPLAPALAAISGYLSVDFFFILSGFVIARAYEARIRGGLSLPDYALIRFRRLYPMLMLGTVLGIAAFFFDPKAQHPLFLSVFEQVTFVPFITADYLYPLNNPQWSILFEISVNFAHLGLIRYLDKLSAIIAITIISIICLGVVCLKLHSVSYGWGSGVNFLIGFPRVGYGFFAGVLLYRARLFWEPLVPRVPFVCLAVFLFAMLMWPGHNNGTRDLVSLIMFPLFIAFGAKSWGFNRLQRYLGELSYPLYTIHYPVLTICAFAVQSAHIQTYLSTIAWVFIILALIVAALFIGRLIDKPLSRKLQQSRPAFGQRQTS